MSSRAAVTVNRPRADVERLWQSPEHRSEWVDAAAAAVRFVDAPGDRGTEVHVEISTGRFARVRGGMTRAHAMDELRHFKQRAETGQVPRSEGHPEGEQASRKLKPRPAQPLEEVGAR